MEKVELWMRLGATLLVTPEQAKAILNQDQNTLECVLKTGNWRFDGDSYIPEIIVSELVEQLGLDPKEYHGDLDFDIGADFSVYDGGGI